MGRAWGKKGVLCKEMKNQGCTPPKRKTRVPRKKGKSVDRKAKMVFVRNFGGWVFWKNFSWRKLPNTRKKEGCASDGKSQVGAGSRTGGGRAAQATASGRLGGRNSLET